jgi:hypothetical protein
MDAEAMVFVVADDAPLRASLQDLMQSVGLRVAAFVSAGALSTCCLLTGSTSMEVHDCLGRQSYGAVGRLVISCQVWYLFPIS